jgi:hypothetical protein
VIEPNVIEPAKSCMSICARSQHGIEARVLTARLFTSMRQMIAFVLLAHCDVQRPVLRWREIVQ